MKKLAALLILGLIISAPAYATKGSEEKKEEMPSPLKEFIIQEMKKDPENLLPPHQKERILSVAGTLKPDNFPSHMLKEIPDEMSFSSSYETMNFGYGFHVDIYDWKTNDPRYTTNFGYRMVRKPGMEYFLKVPKSELYHITPKNDLQ